MTKFTCDSARLHDYADGALAPGERATVDAHLPSCPDCRAELARITALGRRVAAAPRALEPARDLWPELRARIAAAQGALPAAPLRRTSGVRWEGWRVRAAAGIAIAVASSAATVALLGRGDRRTDAPGGPPPNVGAPAPPPATAFTPADDYERTARDLAAALETQRASLAPETIATVEAALRVVDSAIAEGRAALARDPGNAVLAELLLVTYRQKVDVLRRATELPTGI